MTTLQITNLNFHNFTQFYIVRWRWRESNSRLDALNNNLLQVCSVFYTLILRPLTGSHKSLFLNLALFTGTEFQGPVCSSSPYLIVTDKRISRTAARQLERIARYLFLFVGFYRGPKHPLTCNYYIVRTNRNRDTPN